MRAGWLLLVEKQRQRTITAAQVRNQAAFVEHDQGARRALRARLTAGPRQRGPVRVGGIGCGQPPRRLVVDLGPQALIGARQRKLRTTEAGDEVTAPYLAGVLHGFE